MKNFEEYHNLYLKTNVLLLVDIFINYIIMYFKNNSLDLSHYIFAYRMFNDSLYKSSKIKLKLMINMNKYLIVENRIHGRITIANH